MLEEFNKTFNLPEENDKKTQLEPKEIIAKEHLEEMFEITQNLGYNDIRMLKKNQIKDGKKVSDLKNIQKEREE